ncbi:hypothetical protein GCM10020220_065470 [Nonomuraea rubra]|uniref:hypothetical protein n=1 Tax=Nonomuraea rubra TaxID=46180 RepID=UPI0031EB06DC
MPVKRKHALRRPKAGTSPDQGGELSLTSARRYEAFGRVMAALASEADFIESCRDLTWWRGADHSWHVEWRDGPYASEVASLLAEQVRDPDYDGPLVAQAGPGDGASAVLDVMGVRFELRAIDPIGRATLHARRASGASPKPSTPPRRTNTRHPWEELLGG